MRGQNSVCASFHGRFLRARATISRDLCLRVLHLMPAMTFSRPATCAPVTILVAVIIAVVMMWPITNLFRSQVERPTPTIPAFDPDRGSSEARQAAQSAWAPLLTEAARTAAGDGLASLPV